MSDSKAKSAETTATPPYIPWKAFAGYTGSLKTSTVPHTLDSSVRPRSMAGGAWRQLTSTLQFLGLTDAHKVTKESFGKLVKAHGTAEWPATLKAHVVTAYAPIVDGLPLDRATSQQLEKAFRERGHVDGQMLDKAIRFYLHALREAEVKYSDLLAMRKDRPARKPRAAKPKAAEQNGSAGAKTGTGAKAHASKGGGEPPVADEPIPPGTIRFPLYFKGKVPGSILVPDQLDNDDLKVIELTVSVIKAYAAQNKAAK
jgi:hypothetical protein